MPQKTGGAGTRKYGRYDRKPSNKRYRAAQRWIENKNKKLVRHYYNLLKNKLKRKVDVKDYTKVYVFIREKMTDKVSAYKEGKHFVITRGEMRDIFDRAVKLIS